MTTKKKQENVEVKIPPLNLKRVKFKLQGKTPLLMDKYPDRVAEEILAKQSGLKNTKKATRDTKQEIMEAIHFIDGKTKVGYPASSFKASMISAAPRVAGLTKTVVKGIRIVNGENGLIPIKYKKQDVLVRQVGSAKNRSTNTKFSPQFHDWSCELEIRYDANNISATDIATLLDYAGFYVGVGAWRPTCRDGGSGDFGTFEVSKK